MAAWAAVTMTIFFRILKKADFLRAEPADELSGLDISEHGLPSAYADFMPSVDKYAEFGTGEEISVVTGTAPVAEAIPVKREPSFTGHKFTKVEIVFKEEKLFALSSGAGMPSLAQRWHGHIFPSQAYEDGGIHEAIADYEDGVFFNILAEELARRDLDLVDTDPEDFSELTARMDEYMAEFEKNGLNTINIDL